MQMRELTLVLALRLLPGLVLAAAAAAALGGPLGWPAAKVAALLGPLLLCAVAPLAPQVREGRATSEQPSHVVSLVG